MSRTIRILALGAVFASGVALRAGIGKVLRRQHYIVSLDGDDTSDDAPADDGLLDDALLIEYMLNAEDWFPEGMLSGVLPYRVFEAARYLDGDAFVIGVGSLDGDAFYALVSGVPPVGDVPSFEESLEVLRSTLPTLDSDIESRHTLANVTSVVVAAPESRAKCEQIHDEMVALMQGHGDAMEQLASDDVDGMLSRVTSGWLFNSPLLRGQRAIRDLP